MAAIVYVSRCIGLLAYMPNDPVLSPTIDLPGLLDLTRSSLEFVGVKILTPFIFLQKGNGCCAGQRRSGLLQLKKVQDGFPILHYLQRFFCWL